MTSEILRAARREAEALRAELARNEAFQKLQHVQRIIDVYEAYEGGVRTAEAEIKAAPARPVVKLPPARPGTKLAQVEKVVIDHCLETGRRHTSGQFMPILAAAGIEMGGKVPSKTLASMLSNSSRLNNLPGFGYGPKEWGDGPGPGSEKDKTPADLLAGVSQNPGQEAQASVPGSDTGNS